MKIYSTDVEHFDETKGLCRIHLEVAAVSGRAAVIGALNSREVDKLSGEIQNVRVGCPTAVVLHGAEW